MGTPTATPSQHAAASAKLDVAAKAAIYPRLLGQAQALLDGLQDEIAAMATLSSLLKENLPYASWAGFYRVVGPELLRVGPYQGPVGCLEIAFARGVCGAAARTQSTLVINDVNAFPGHIACDAAARSEVVVPVFDTSGSLRAVLDLDSHEIGSFDQQDRQGLERIVALLPACFGVSDPPDEEPATL